jgi:hypothetical protein
MTMPKKTWREKHLVREENGVKRDDKHDEQKRDKECEGEVDGGVMGKQSTYALEVNVGDHKMNIFTANIPTFYAIYRR